MKINIKALNEKAENYIAECQKDYENMNFVQRAVLKRMGVTMEFQKQYLTIFFNNASVIQASLNKNFNDFYNQNLKKNEFYKKFVLDANKHGLVEDKDYILVHEIGV